jgi:SAM-dependent MidA family methyltransferase
VPGPADEIRAEIARRGPISFDRFMELALYHPEHGYYCRRRDPFGVAGDYFTNAQLQPVFGRLIAQQILRWRGELGAADFTVVELGAGRGETAQVVREAAPGVTYLEVERDRGSLPERITGVVFSNEFFDALPVKAARFSGGRWRERLVGEQGGRFVWVQGGPVSAEAESYLKRCVPAPGEGRIAEIGLEALRWLERVAAALERGYVLTIDYGYTAAESARFPRGSLMAYTHHLAVEDVLAEPGERDITAHVAWTALLERGQECGLRARPLQSQAQFLLSAGEADGFQAALAAPDEAAARRHRTLLKTLLYGMGETFQVLIFEK